MPENSLKKKNELKRKSEPLTREEWWTFFIFPFFTTKPNYRDDHYSQSELERFREYGFDNKIKEAIKVKLYGQLFWSSIIIIIVLIIIYP